MHSIYIFKVRYTISYIIRTYSCYKNMAMGVELMGLGEDILNAMDGTTPGNIHLYMDEDNSVMGNGVSGKLGLNGTP